MIVITAPTSTIGSQVLDNLLAADEPVRVIARDPSKLPEAVRERVEVVEGSHGDGEVVERAFEGADALFWLAPPNPVATSLAEVFVDFARPAAQAMKRRGIGHVEPALDPITEMPRRTAGNRIARPDEPVARATPRRGLAPPEA